MTAPEDNESGSDNSGSRTPTRDESSTTTRQDCLPLAAHVADAGWTTGDRLALDLGLTRTHVAECLRILNDADDLDVHELGTTTLVIAPGTDVEDAIAELSDQREREWRARTNDRMPDRGDFR